MSKKSIRYRLAAFRRAFWRWVYVHIDLRLWWAFGKGDSDSFWNHPFNARKRYFDANAAMPRRDDEVDIYRHRD